MNKYARRRTYIPGVVYEEQMDYKAKDFLMQNKATSALICCAILIPIYAKKTYLQNKRKIYESLSVMLDDEQKQKLMNLLGMF